MLKFQAFFNICIRFGVLKINKGIKLLIISTVLHSVDEIRR